MGHKLAEIHRFEDNGNMFVLYHNDNGSTPGPQFPPLDANGNPISSEVLHAKVEEAKKNKQPIQHLEALIDLINASHHHHESKKNDITALELHVKKLEGLRDFRNSQLDAQKMAHDKIVEKVGQLQQLRDSHSEEIVKAGGELLNLQAQIEEARALKTQIEAELSELTAQKADIEAQLHTHDEQTQIVAESQATILTDESSTVELQPVHDEEK